MAQSSNDYSSNSDSFGQKPDIRAFEKLSCNLIHLEDPYGRTEVNYNEWKAGHSISGPFHSSFINTIVTGPALTETDRFVIVVNTNLYDSLYSEINLYALDVAGEGFDVDIYSTSGGTPEEFRAFLQSLYSMGMEGCVLIGDFPVAWYEKYGCFGRPHQEEFACDLFYMDLDGVFVDTDFDGMYDQHTGSVEPDIWLGRLTASPLTLDDCSEVSLLREYFHKNHLYRCNLTPVPNHVLIYNDNDCYIPYNYIEILTANTFDEYTIIDDPWVTWDTDYETRLTQPGELIQPCVHSSPLLHAFGRPNGEWGYTENWEIKAIDVAVHFYNLVSCSIARFTTNDYMAGWYIFGQGCGLTALGSTKDGSMIYFHDFYPSLAEQKPIGRAYLDWIGAQAASGFYDWEVCYFYGMTIIGDPTLRIQKKSNSRALRYDTEWGGPSFGLPNSYNLDYFNTRFTAPKNCQLAALLLLAIPWVDVVTARFYIWESDGTFPTNPIDSIDFEFSNVGVGEWLTVDVSDLGLEFTAGQDFHVGYTVLDPGAGGYIVQHSCEWNDTLPVRSSVFYNGSWVLLNDINSESHNFCLRAIVVEEESPEIDILTLTVPMANLNYSYHQSLAATGGLPPYSWNLAAGNLPEGITLDSDSGILSGTPVNLDTAHFTVRVSDNSSPELTDFQHLTIIVQNCVDSDSDGFGDPGHPENTCPPDNCPLVHNPEQEDSNADGTGDACCCAGSTGNVDCSEIDDPDISDITRLIDFLYINHVPLCCPDEADVDASGGEPDISDITRIIDCLYISHEPLISCP